jgi:prophage regulatory protein
MAYNKPPGAKLKRNPPELPVEWASDLQIAKRYGVARCTVWRWRNEGRLPEPTKIAANTTRWRLSEVIEALEGED